MTLLSNCLSSVPAYSPLSEAKLPPRKTFIWLKPISYFSAIHAQRRICELIDLHRQQIPYEVAWSWQKELVREKKAQIEGGGCCTDTLIVLQHPPVYTLGTASSEDNLNFDFDNAPFDIYRTERGGQVTYHGPGQEPGGDCHPCSFFNIFNRSFLNRRFNWCLGNQNVAAVGIRVSQWITYHGLAFNVTTDLTPFNWIVPCGIRDRQVGSIKGLLRELGSFIGYGTANSPPVDDASLIHNTHKSLVKEFSQVFELEYLHKTISVPGFV